MSKFIICLLATPFAIIGGAIFAPYDMWHFMYNRDTCMGKCCIWYRNTEEWY